MRKPTQSTDAGRLDGRLSGPTPAMQNIPVPQTEEGNRLRAALGRPQPEIQADYAELEKDVVVRHGARAAVVPLSAIRASPGHRLDAEFYTGPGRWDDAEAARLAKRAARLVKRAEQHRAAAEKERQESAALGITSWEVE